MEREWYIGIDFGTSNTCVIAYDKANGELYTGDLTEKIGNAQSLNIPTAIACEHIDSSVAQKTNSRETDPNWQEFLTTVFHMDDKGDCTYIGEETKAHPVLRPFKDLKNTARKFTPNNGTFGEGAIKFPFSPCGLDSNLELGNEDYPLTRTAQQLIVQFLKRVLHIGEEKFGINEKTVKKIVIGQPVVNNNGVSYDKTLKELLSECFTGEEDNEEFIGKKTEKGWEDGIITVAAEPELAGVTYLSVDEKRAERKVLVVDIGGGTTDFCVLRYEKDENGKDKFKAENIGSCNTAGNAIDDLIFSLLPPGFPKSKAQCRKWKEQLFDKNNGSVAEIKPIETKALGRVGIGAMDDNTDWFLSYNYIPDVKNIIALNFETTEESKDSKVDLFGKFSEIGKALETALGKLDERSQINTIFFVGGTSIITPLREHLTEVAKKACGHKLDVVDMFGKNAKQLTADWGKPLPVTCYNAVAIGACIKAMGEKLLCVKPNVNFKLIKDRTANLSSDKNLSIKTESGVVIGGITLNKSNLKSIFDAYKYEYGECLNFECIIDGKIVKTYKLHIHEKTEGEAYPNVYDLTVLVVLKTDRSGIEIYNFEIYNYYVPEEERPSEKKSNDETMRQMYRKIRAAKKLLIS